jgi:N-acetylglucosaminyldiphosphoundecaprenol N-acetyl-beta-D-mannosaminyltransferase
LRDRFTGLRVVGTTSPPFRPLTREEDEQLVETINDADPDVVWVGLSTPKQERWMAAHVGRLRAPVLVGVGAAFDFHAGVKRQAPRWMQRSGLEWLFRLASEPRRLGRRYLVNNPSFVWGVARARLRTATARRPESGRMRGNCVYQGNVAGDVRSGGDRDRDDGSTAGDTRRC